jgi:hypothetical protein
MDEMDTDAPKKPWGKWIGIFFGVLLLLVLVAYFVGTSSAFVKGVILPKVGAAMNAKITVGDISVSPFSRVDIRQLRVETTGSEPLLTADEARVRYSLMDIVKGNINVNEVLLATPVINIVQEPDGSSNLDPLTKGEKKSKPKSNEPTKLSIQNVSLKNGTVRETRKANDGSITHIELQGLSIDLDRLGNGQKGHINLASSFAVDEKHGATNNALAGQVSGGYDVSLNQELMPDTLQGSLKLTLSRADGSFKDLAGLTGSLDADLTPKEIRQIALRFARNDQPLGQVRISGPMDVDKKEGHLTLEINQIDKNVLALATAGKGLDLGNSHVNSTNQITISQGGTFFSANGNVAATSITVSQGTLKTPEMNLNLDYQVAVNSSDKSATLQRVNLAGTSNGKEFLRTALDRQMSLSWNDKAKGYPDAALDLVLTNFNVAEWRALAGTNVNSGIVNAKVTLASKQDGRQLNADMAARIDNLSAQAGTNRIENAALTFESSATIEQLKVVNVPRYTLALRQNDAQVLQASGAARYVLETQDTTAQLTLEGALPRLLALASVPDAKANGGNLKVTANYTDNGTKRSAVGNVGLTDFTGSYQKYAFTNFGVALDYNVDIDKRDVTLNRTALTFNQGFNRGGTVELKGKYNLENKSGQFNFNTVDLNQNVFGPVLAPSLGENQLVSISLNASGEAKLDPKAESSIKASVKLANWVVQDKAGKLPKTPLALEMQIDGAMRKEVLDLRQFLVQLSATARAKNALLLQAKLDLAKTNASPSTLSLSSESFDLTPYYDLFAGPSTAEKTKASPVMTDTQPTVAAPGEQKEPAAIQLPIQQLTADLRIDRLYLREVAISNWVGKVAIRSNVVQLNPFQLNLNGAPVSVTGNVNVGWPGYLYDVALKAASVPLAPLANSFGSGKTNSIQGTLIADAQVRGAGTTGPNLRKNLAGNANLNLTNLNYEVVGPKLKRILVPISVALNVPEVAQSPINWVAAQIDVGNGQANLKHLGVESEAFYAESSGTITLNDIITNSVLNLPVDLSLPRSLAEKTRLASGDTSTNKYVKLPRFVSIKGTLGSAEPEINKLAVFGIAAREAAAFGLGGAKTQGALGAVGNLLTGQTGGTNNASTNSTANLVQGLGSLLGAKTATNNPSSGATNSSRDNLSRALGGLLNSPTTATNNKAATENAATNAVQNALDSLLRPKPKKK